MYGYVLAELCMWWPLSPFVVQPGLEIVVTYPLSAVSLLQLDCMHAVFVVASLVCHDSMPAMQPC
jgi:hypothetical protein